MASLSASHDVSAPPAAVWAVVTGIDDWVDVIDAIESVERLDAGKGFGIGTKWRETRVMFGKSATEVMEVSEFEAGSRYATTAASHGSKYFSEIRVDPSPTGSTVTMNFRGEPESALAKVMDLTIGRLFVGATKKMLLKDLVDIGTAAEASAGR